MGFLDLVLGGVTKSLPLYLTFKLRKARVTKLCNHIHHQVCFKNIEKFLADFSIFLITSSNIDSTTRRSCEIHYFIIFCNYVSSKMFFIPVFSKLKVQEFHIAYFHSKLEDINLHYQNFGQCFKKIKTFW